MKTCARLRVDFVGSFLRPQFLKDALEGLIAGSLSADAYRAAEDRAIEELVAEQIRRGLPIIGDGEFRRRQFMESFGDVAGMEPFQAALTQSVAARTTVTPPPKPLHLEAGKAEGGERRPVTRRLALTRNRPLAEYAFVSALTTTPVKVTVLGPERIGQRIDYAASRAVYPGGADEFLNDVVKIEREIIAGLRSAGCPYIHIDAPGYTAYCDDEVLATIRARGDDPDVMVERAIRADNATIAGWAGTTFGIHLCRGNSRSQWHRQGGYEAIAERVFSELNHDRFLLEYDDDRSGGFEPLRFMPKGKIAVLGLITTKSGVLESADQLIRRIDEAAKYLPVDQLAISPQCGFASGVAGNLLSEDDQWKKIDLMLLVAQRVWG